MKKISTLLIVCIFTTGFTQNIITNGDFETNALTPWGGFKNQITVDQPNGTDNSFVGNINNGDGSLFQVVKVIPGASYTVNFKYRWVSGSGGYVMTTRVKNGATGGSDLGTFVLNTTPDVWHTGNFTFTTGSSVITARIIFFKANGNRPLRIDDVSITLTPSITWDGSENSDWNTAANWDSNTVPTASDIILIPAGTPNGPTASVAISFDELSIQSGASLIAQSSVSGKISYNVTLTDDNWHLLSSPTITETYNNNWVSGNAIASGTGNNRGISKYDNGAPDATTGPWRYFQAGTSDAFNSGTGYALKKSSAGNIGFRGDLQTSDVTTTITQDVSHWNLIGNPYPSYIDISSFLSTNETPLSDANEAVYVWDASTNSYIALTTGYIHPGQAFFVNSNEANTTVSITEAMQSHQTGVTFYRTENTIPSIDLILSDGTITRSTQINYFNDKTTGLDPKFDLGMFDGDAAGFRLYSHLVANDQGIGFMRQALPKDYENLIIPIGVKAANGKEIMFSANILNLPSEINVFLEDRVKNRFIRLNETNNTYKVTLTEALDGTGRFYLHTTQSSLSTQDVVLENVHIYKPDASTLGIMGLPQGSTTVKVFTILGKQLLHTSFESKGTNTIVVPKLTSGVYIVQLNTKAGKLNKKIILE